MKPGRRGSGRGLRELRVKVRTARGRKLSSSRWLSRQLNDPYVRMARADGYRARSAYKLRDLDDRYGFLFPGARVLDLGCAPGGWTMVAVERVNAQGGRPAAKAGRVIGIDLLEVDPIPGAELHVLDFLSDGAPERIKCLAGAAVDVVLSDMAAPSSGHRQTDHLRIMALCEAVTEFSLRVLAHRGTLVVKVLSGGAESGLYATLNRGFGQVVTAKPPSSRPGSSEKYVVATGFRGPRAK